MIGDPQARNDPALVRVVEVAQKLDVIVAAIPELKRKWEELAARDGDTGCESGTGGAGTGRAASTQTIKRFRGFGWSVEGRLGRLPKVAQFDVHTLLEHPIPAKNNPLHCTTRIAPSIGAQQHVAALTAKQRLASSGLALTKG